MKKAKIILLLLGMIMPVAWCGASSNNYSEGTSHINVYHAHVEGVPKENSIQASITGHVLSVVFTENLGQVVIDITTASGATVDYSSLNTPNGVSFYIPNTGNYIVYFTLSNGDQYYGEFEVTEYATLEAIEKMKGGTRTQADFKKLGDIYLQNNPNATLEEYFEYFGYQTSDPSTMEVGTIENALLNNQPIVVEDAVGNGGHTMTIVRIRQWTANSPKRIWFADPSKTGLSKYLFNYLFNTRGLYLFNL